MFPVVSLEMKHSVSHPDVDLEVSQWVLVERQTNGLKTNKLTWGNILGDI